MKDLNNVVLIGNLTRDNETKYTTGGYCVVKFSIAVKNNKKINGNYEDVTSFFDCEWFGKGAEAISQYLVKGQKVSIQGYLEQEQWKDKTTGNNRSKVLIKIDNLWLIGGQKQAPQQQRQQTRHQIQNVKQNPQQSYPTPQPQQMFAPQQPVAPENFEDDNFSDVPF